MVRVCRLHAPLASAGEHWRPWRAFRRSAVSMPIPRRSWIELPRLRPMPPRVDDRRPLEAAPRQRPEPPRLNGAAANHRLTTIESAGLQRHPDGADVDRSTALAVAHSRFSGDLEMLRATYAGRPITVRELEQAMRGRGFAVLLMLFAIPFCTPVPLPGLSTPFGLAIALIGARLGLGLAPWLPDMVLNRSIKPTTLERLVRWTLRVVRPLERLLRPRLGIMCGRVPKCAAGWAIAVCGLLLCLPLPIPTSNFFAALPVVLLAAALMERDGFVLVLGYGAFLMALAYFGGVAWLGFEGVDEIWQRVF